MLAASSTALACEGLYDTGDMLTDLTNVETALRTGDVATAGAVSTKMQGQIACLGESIPFMIVGRIYRGIGAGLVASGDDARGNQWFLTALEADPTFDYGTEDLPIGSPIRERYLSLRDDADADAVDADGELAEGRYYLDGSIAGPRATPGRPHLLQRNLDGTITGWVVEGAAFPAEVLSAAVAEAPPEETPAPRGRDREAERARRDAERAARRAEAAAQTSADPDAPGPQEAPPPPPRPSRGANQSGVVVVRPGEKTPLLIGGATAIVGAGALYFLSSRTHQQFDGATTKSDMDRYQRQTNQLVLISAAALATGASALTWGVMLEGGGPGIGLHVRY